MSEEELLVTDLDIKDFSKPDKRQKRKSFMSIFNNQYWLNSPNKEWEDKALESYKRLSKRAK